MIKTCILCGQQFETKRSNQKICNREHFKTCPVCGKRFKITRDNYKKQTCSNACMKAFMSKKLSSEEVRVKTENTNVRKYGTKAPSQNEGVKKKLSNAQTAKTDVEKRKIQEKRKATNKRLYGVENPSKLNSVKEKQKASLQMHYGVDNPGQSKVIQEKVKVTCLERYGVENPQQNSEIKSKTAKTNSQKYGSKSPLGSKIIQQKIRQTNRRNLGVNYPFQSYKIQSKIKSTNKERYGYEFPMKNPSVKQKMIETSKERHGGILRQVPEIEKARHSQSLREYGTDYPLQSKEVKNALKAKNLEKYGVEYTSQLDSTKEHCRETMNEKYGVNWPCQLPQAIEANGHIISKTNKAVAQFINNCGFDTEFEYVLGNRSYDIFIKDTNILVEVDPTYTHNALGDNIWGTARDQYYHVKKSKYAEDNGFRCVHIFDWEDSKKVIKSVLPARHSIYARKCEIQQVDKRTANEFENRYHIQGDVRGQSVCLGLYHTNKYGVNELIEIMTFGKPRYSKSYEWELLRLCTKSGIRVLGGASRLFCEFNNTYSPSSIISYCDISKFNGSVYSKIGMKLIRVTEPTKVWSNGKSYITNNLLLQRGYDQIFNSHYGKGTSNEDLMIDHGWLPVYDCGQRVFEWRKSS